MESEGISKDAHHSKFQTCSHGQIVSRSRFSQNSPRLLSLAKMIGNSFFMRTGSTNRARLSKGGIHPEGKISIPHAVSATIRHSDLNIYGWQLSKNLKIREYIKSSLQWNLCQWDLSQGLATGFTATRAVWGRQTKRKSLSYAIHTIIRFSL